MCGLSYRLAVKMATVVAVLPFEPGRDLLREIQLMFSTVWPSSGSSVAAPPPGGGAGLDSDRALVVDASRGRLVEEDRILADA